MRRLLSILFPVLVIALLTIASNADATLRRLPRTWHFGPQPVWTDGTTGPMFHPMSEPMESAGLLNVRVTYELSEDSGDCELRPALRYSDEGTAWDAAKEILSTYQNGNGIKAGTTYVDITQLAGTTTRSFVQFGVQVRNGTNGAIQHCNATLRVEPQQVR